MRVAYKHWEAPMVWKPPFFLPRVENENGTENSHDDNHDSGNCSLLEEDAGPWVNDAERIGYTYVVPVICAFGFVFNILTFVVLMDRHFHKMTFLLLKVLALADATTLIVTLPFGPTACSRCPLTTAGMARLVYHVYIYPSISNMSETVSAWVTLALGVERVHAMRHWSVQGGVSLSAFRAKVIVVTILISAVVINLPFLFSMEISECHSRGLTKFGNSLEFGVYSWIRASLVQFLPLALLCFLNVALLVLMSRWSQGVTLAPAWSTMNRRQKAHRRLTAMLLGTIIVFLMSHIPVAFAYFPIFCSMVNCNNEEFRHVYATHRIVSHSLSLVGYSLDFVVYCMSNSHFRFTACDIFCRQCNSRKRIQPSCSKKEVAKSPADAPTAIDLSDRKSSSPVPDTTFCNNGGDSPVPLQGKVSPVAVLFSSKVAPEPAMNRY